MQGIVDSVHIENGKFLSSADPVAEILQIDRVKIEVGIPESDVDSIRKLHFFDITVLAGAFAVLIICFQIWCLKIGIEKPLEFFLSIDPRSAYINIDPPEGADLDFIDRTTKKVEIAITGNQGSYYGDAMRLQEHETSDGIRFMAPTDINNIEHIYTKVVQNSFLFAF